MDEKWDLKRGNLYKIRSRNLPYGVYDGEGGFTGIREKFDELYLFTEYDRNAGGTVAVLEDLGPIPEGVDPGGWRGNRALFEFLVQAEQQYGRGEGCGGRPGDDYQEGSR